MAILICFHTINGRTKYYNFFIESWIELFEHLGYHLSNNWTLRIVLPVGISFYTFQTLSYSLDIYYKKLIPTKGFISFAAFVSFFPQLVAGPIERASNLLPQILTKRKFNYKNTVNGLKLILWGLFKKVVIADSLAPIVEEIFKNYHQLNGGTLLLGTVYFAFQIYGDFSGYSDIAVGSSKLFGIELMSNFKFPYLSRNIAEFWRRWHISLSTWFRDYLYIPLGGSKLGELRSLNNIFVIFIVSGFWHGANWTFIVWGLIHATLYIPLFLLKKNRNYTENIVAKNKYLPSIKEFLKISATFTFVCFAWIFFRSDTILDSFSYMIRIFTKFDLSSITFKYGIVYCLILFVLDWLFRGDERLLLGFRSKILAYFIFWFVVISEIVGETVSFIYFQF